MNGETMERGNKEISVATLYAILKRSFIWIVVAAVVAGILGGVYTLVFKRTEYSATVEFNVVNALSNNEYTSDSMLSAASRIADTCIEVAHKNVLHRAIVESNNIDALLNCSKDEAIRRVAELVSATKATENSQIFSVTVKSDDKTLTYVLIKAIQVEMPKIAKEVTTSNDEAQNAAVLKVVSEVTGESSIKTIQPSVFRNAIIFAFVAGVLVYMSYFVGHILDTKVYDEETLKESFTSPVIGSVPAWYNKAERAMPKKKLLEQQVSIKMRLFNDKLITSKNTPFAVTESFNTLRTNLLYSIPPVECPVFVVTSDFSAAGKSVVSSNLALSLATLGKKVLIVEGDMRCPDFTKIFGENKNGGLSELLSGNVLSSDDVIVKNVYPNLDVLHSGLVPPNPSELLSASRMKELVEAWRKSYDIIIIDTPPVLEVVDACVLSPIVNGYILVARSAYSDVKALREAVASIDSVNGNFVGFIINAVGSKQLSDGYSYGKYQNYGKYRKYYKYDISAEDADISDK